MNLTIVRFNPFSRVKVAALAKGGALLLSMMLGLVVAFPSFALDLNNLGAVGGSLAEALTTLGELSSGVKALVAFIGFVVALISLASLRNMGPVLFFIGLAIFGAVGLTIAGTIMSADVSDLATIAAL